MDQTEADLIADLNQLDHVVADTNKFKIKLAIGEDAYASLRTTKALQMIWDVKGAGAAGAGLAASPTVAATFFGGGSTFLSALGLTSAAATPVGWVVAAAVVSGGAYYGAMRWFGRYSESRVEAIPRFINTPIDFLGATLYDMMAGLALKVAEFDGKIDPAEREAIISYFGEEWGLSQDYAERALPLIESQVRERSLKDMVRSLAEFQVDNPDCNPSAMAKDIRTFLDEIANSDGFFDEREAIAIEAIEAELTKRLAMHKKIIRRTTKLAGSAGKLAGSAGSSVSRSLGGLLGRGKKS